MLEIDGSFLEGGGAIVRVAAALSAITGKSARILNIRAKRENPGLMPQHLESLRAIATLCSGDLINAAPGSTEVELHPRQIRAGQIPVEIGTAGSIGLLFQSLSAAMCMANGDTGLLVKGGATFGKWAPPLLATRHVLLPLLQKMGYSCDIEIRRHGFFPKGGASVMITAHPCAGFSPLLLTERGDVRFVAGVSIASNHLQRAKVADRQAQAAKEALAREHMQADIDIEYVDAACPGSGIVLWTRTTSGAWLGADSIGERGKPSEKIGEDAATNLLRTIRSGATVDEHVSDQLLIFMALADGQSAMSVARLTNHAKTNMNVIKQFLPVEFHVQEDTIPTIRCKGSGKAANRD